jgi:hypothetical protein
MPQIQVENVGSDNFIVSAIPILLSDEFNEFVVDATPVREPKGRSRRQVVKHNEFLLRSNTSMVPFFCLHNRKEETKEEMNETDSEKKNTHQNKASCSSQEGRSQS